MKTARGGFEQCYNGQIAVDMDSLLITKTDTVQATNDKQPVSPMLEQLATLPEQLGTPTTLVADTGYYSEANVKTCVKHTITPLIAVKREAHHLDPMERYTEPPPLPWHPLPAEVVQCSVPSGRGDALHGLPRSAV